MMQINGSVTIECLRQGHHSSRLCWEFVECWFLGQAVWKRPEIAVLSDSALGEFALES